MRICLPWISLWLYACREILKTLSPAELERYEVFRRSSLSKANMKKVARLLCPLDTIVP